MDTKKRLNRYEIESETMTSFSRAFGQTREVDKSSRKMLDWEKRQKETTTAAPCKTEGGTGKVLQCSEFSSSCAGKQYCRWLGKHSLNCEQTNGHNYVKIVCTYELQNFTVVPIPLSSLAHIIVFLCREIYLVTVMSIREGFM